MSTPRMFIGDAPRAIVHAACARPGEIVLGTSHPTDTKCKRCKTPVLSGVVVQASAPKESYRAHRR